MQAFWSDVATPQEESAQVGVGSKRPSQGVGSSTVQLDAFIVQGPQGRVVALETFIVSAQLLGFLGTHLLGKITSREN